MIAGIIAVAAAFGLLYFNTARANSGSDLTLQNTPALEKHLPQDINDIYPPLPLPEPFNWPAVALAVLAVLIGAAALFYFTSRKSKKRATLVIPAHEAALAELARARKYLNTDTSLIYAERASDILRTYIEKRFNIRSTRQTTSEFLATIYAAENQEQQELWQGRLALEKFLRLCDLAKYAHKTSARQALEEMEDGIRSFIEDTIVKEQD